MVKLAIDGGNPSVSADHNRLKWPILPQAAKDRVNELLNKIPAEISIGKTVDDFVEKFLDYLDAEFIIPLMNGTAGLFTAYTLLGVKPGDEVICPSYTYWASAMPAAYLGAKLVFAEIDPVTLCIDPEDVKSKITPKTKVITPVHVWGMPCEMDAIMEIAEENKIKVLEDASHAHGSEYHNQKIGTFGDMAVFSLQGSKLMPGGEGGLLVIKDDFDAFAKGLSMAHYERARAPYLTPDHPEIKYMTTTSQGFKFRMSPLHAAIAETYLDTLDADNEKRNTNCEHVRKAAEQIPGMKAFIPDSSIKRVYYENIIEYDECKSSIPFDQMMKIIEAEGGQISTSRYPLLHQQPYYKDQGYQGNELPITEAVTARLLKFPNFSNNTQDIAEQYVQMFRKIKELS